MTTDENNEFRLCFAYNGAVSSNCAALTEKLCESRHKCPFFKTKDQFEADRKAAARINAQNAIKKKAISSAKVRK